VHRDDGPMAFELAKLCGSGIAKTTSRMIKAGGVRAEAFLTADPTQGVFLAKIQKTYRCDHPIDLLLYNRDRVITPDDVILPTLEHLIEVHGRGPFRKIFLMGEEICREV
jgi:hypothetical protein